MIKKIILIITGSIAAPKGIELYNDLKKHYQVELVLSRGAQKFIQTMPKDAHIEMFKQDFYDKSHASLHIEIALNADLLIVYPASHNFIAKISHGLSDDLSTLVFSATNSHKMIFPAMNTHMFNNPANLNNIKLLSSFGIEVLMPQTGLLACNAIGLGRAWEWIDVTNHINQFFQLKNQLKNKNVLINFGRTRTYLDPIRYLTNNSSGKMGIALYNALKLTSANLTAISGDIDMDINFPVIKVTTNQQMWLAMKQHFNHQDIVISVASLNDFKVENVVNHKLNKQQNAFLNIKLSPNIDVLEQLGRIKTKQILIGFSAQDDENDEVMAKQKLKRKYLDAIVVNNIKVMNQDHTSSTWISPTKTLKLTVGTKLFVAQQIVKQISELVK